ncbi:MAG: porin, partial [Burkholderiaceae bacterium]
ASYEVIQYADAGSARTFAGNPDTKLFSIGGTVDFKFVKLHLAYADQKAVTTIYNNATNLPPTLALPTVGNWDNTAYMGGVTVPLFGGQLLASYQASDADNINTATFQFEPDYNVWGVGYTYPLSRRTNIYVAYGQRQWDGNIAATGGSVALSQAAQIFDASQFALGIRHLF